VQVRDGQALPGPAGRTVEGRDVAFQLESEREWVCGHWSWRCCLAEYPKCQQMNA